MKVHKVRQAMASEKADIVLSRSTVRSNDGKGVLQYEFVGKTLSASKLVKRPTLLGSLLARIGALPVLPPVKPQGRRGPKPKNKGVTA